MAQQEEAAQIDGPADCWAVVGPNRQAVVYPTRDLPVIFQAGTATIPRYTPIAQLDGTPHIDLTAKVWLVVAAAGQPKAFLIPEATILLVTGTTAAPVNGITTALAGAGIGGNWAPIRRIMRTHHTDFQMF